MADNKILHINSVPYGSTCKIMLGIKAAAEAKGFVVRTSSGYSYHPLKEIPRDHIAVGSALGKLAHTLAAKLTGYNGCFSIIATLQFLHKIEKNNYSIIHLHNLHGWYLNLPILFNYIKKKKLKVIWTLHDCWAFTGHCPHFEMEKCEKWKTGCYHCPRHTEYPKTFVDQSRTMWKLKKRWFTGIENMTLVTPSEWLAGLVEQSFLKEYPVRVINNGIDLNVFKPAESNFRKKYGIPQDKFIILGVAFGWGRRKGLDVFIELAKRLDERFQIVLVGTDHNVDKQLPNTIISIHRTENQQQLAEIYTAADVFVNPTREDNYPTVNMEAIACGTPVVTFETGGSPEMIDGTCGTSVACNDIDTLEREILRVYVEKPYSRETCVSHAKRFDMYDKFSEYAKLYGWIML